MLATTKFNVCRKSGAGSLTIAVSATLLPGLGILRRIVTLCDKAMLANHGAGGALEARGRRG
jgi:hypothetical protein